MIPITTPLLLLIISSVILGKSDNQEINPALKEQLEAFESNHWARQLLDAAYHPQCSPPTSWFQDQIWRSGLSGRDLDFLNDHHVFSLAHFYKFFVDRSESSEYFGYDGQNTAELNRAHDRVGRFWEETDDNGLLNTNDILLLGMHGSDLQHDGRLVPTLRLLYPSWSYQKAKQEADDIQAVIKKMQGRFNNPLLTANAVAIKGGDFLGNNENYQDAIVIGDGIIKMLEDEGLGRDGPDFIHAHEYGHHMQYEVSIVDGPEDKDTPSESRYVELMADAFGGYFLDHEAGRNFTKGEIKQMHKTAFLTGDCSVGSDEHHGTPYQRECSTMWAAQVADSSNSTDILHPLEFKREFDTVLPALLQIDSENMCEGWLDGTIKIDLHNSIESAAGFRSFSPVCLSVLLVIAAKTFFF